MHMADALLSSSVAATMYATSTVAVGYSVNKINKEDMADKLPVMGVMSAFVFAGQMINFTIPGTGSSGHLCGGVMLSALLGPEAGFLSMVAILLIQCFLFADGGILALGANFWNMAFYGCFVGYYLIYRPIMRRVIAQSEGTLSANVANGSINNNKTKVRFGITLASILACVITLQMGAFSVCLETTASGITELPIGAFAALMQPIHLAIGLVEGVITAAVLNYIYEVRPELVEKQVMGKQSYNDENSLKGKKTDGGRIKGLIVTVAIVTALVAGIGSHFASGNPDGLEWSLFGNAESGYSANMGLDEENYGYSAGTESAHRNAEAIQEKTALLPDYAFASNEENPLGTSVSGILGSAIVAGLAIGILSVVKTIGKKRE